MRRSYSSQVVNFLVSDTVIACVRSTPKSFEIEKKNDIFNKKSSNNMIDQCIHSQSEPSNIILMAVYQQCDSSLVLEDGLICVDID